eukprot:CAMPEP_0178423230 /NCGR_PEP_ID=MMETSP0689_2-20121128/27581_1 /TAXON_ID=160604 /ORGANISM="Amphidinium massartii, Strain CS-259" /LENGTH=319 /DNA_ID=CAMNT_0020044817 /DNA_START=128 /DNA_END=1087 /DNA_ORIENTATION=+
MGDPDKANDPFLSNQGPVKGDRTQQQAQEDARKKAKRETRNKSADMALAVTLPWIIFFISLCLFIFAYDDIQILVWIALVFFSLIAVLVMALGVLSGQPLYLGVGLLCVSAIVLASALGVYLDEEYLNRYGQLDGGTRYTNVNPTQNVSATADASVLSFMNFTFVDDRRTIGWVEDQEIACIAPVVVPPVYRQDMGYWATGINCCDMRSNFDCGAARDRGTLKAVVAVEDERYRKALKEAKAVYGISTNASDAMLLSFVEDPDGMIGGLWDQAIMVGLLASLIYLLVSVMAGLMLSRVLAGRPRKQGLAASAPSSSTAA